MRNAISYFEPLVRRFTFSLVFNINFYVNRKRSDGYLPIYKSETIAAFRNSNIVFSTSFI